MSLRTNRFIPWLLPLWGMLYLQLGAEPVTQQMAQQAAENWAALPQLALESPFAGKQVSGVWEERSGSGEVLFYCVEFGGAGFVVTAADDGIMPVVAFSGTGRISRSGKNPLREMLSRDLAQRLQRVQALEALQWRSSGVLGVQGLSPGYAADIARNQAVWQELTAPMAMPLKLAAIPDVRVSPMLNTTWSQEGVAGKPTYNYYTPTNYPCGCVATAMAQLMRYHQHPESTVAAVTHTCYIDDYDNPISLTIMGGNYNWSEMVEQPTGSITDNQRRAIGRLTYDAGVAVYMNYGEWGSGSNTGVAAAALRDIFHYNSAYALTRSKGINMTDWRRAVLPNLDGGYPVILGIHSAQGYGHAVVADGYGYVGIEIYVHLNMGWGGLDDAWYNLPDVDDGWYGFDTINTVVYNIYPDESGESVSGRTIMSDGTPLEGVTVSAIRGNEHYTTTTDASGIYAFRLGGVATPYNLSATWGDQTKSASVSLIASESTTYIPPINFYTNTGKIGNNWSNNLVFDSPLVPQPEILSATIIDYNGMPCIRIEFAGVAGFNYAVERATSIQSGGGWVAIAWDTPSSDGMREVIIALPEGQKQCFYRVTAW